MVEGLRCRCSASVLRLVRRVAFDSDFDFVMFDAGPASFKNSSKLLRTIVKLYLGHSTSVNPKPGFALDVGNQGDEQ
jgi:hypothetical protein